MKKPESEPNHETDESLKRESDKIIRKSGSSAPSSWLEEWVSTPPLQGGLPSPPKTHRTGEIKLFDRSEESQKTSSQKELSDGMLDYYYEQIDTDPWHRVRFLTSSMSKKEYAEILRRADARRMREFLQDPFGETRRAAAAAAQRQSAEREQVAAARRKASEHYSAGETVTIRTGEYAGYSGVVESVDIDKSKMKVRPNPRESNEWVQSVEVNSKTEG